MRGAQQGDVKALQAALDAGASADVKDASPFRTTALHWASQYGHAPCVRALLAANAAVDATNSFRQSALQCCTFEGHTKVAEILLAAGADPLHEDLIYGSAIHFAKHEKPRNHAKMHRLLAAAARRTADAAAAAAADAAAAAADGARRPPHPVAAPAAAASSSSAAASSSPAAAASEEAPGALVSCEMVRHALDWLAALCEHGDSLRDATARALLRPSVLPLLLCLRRSCDSSRAEIGMTQPLSVLDDLCYPLLMLHSFKCALAERTLCLYPAMIGLCAAAEPTASTPPSPSGTPGGTPGTPAGAAATDGDGAADRLWRRLAASVEASVMAAVVADAWRRRDPAVDLPR